MVPGLSSCQFGLPGRTPTSPRAPGYLGRMVTPIAIAAKKRDAAPPVYTAAGITVPPGTYGRWLAAVVSHFSDDAVKKWKNNTPQCWSLDAWLARKRARALDRAG